MIIVRTDNGSFEYPTGREFEIKEHWVYISNADGFVIGAHPEHRIIAIVREFPGYADSHQAATKAA